MHCRGYEDNFAIQNYIGSVINLSKLSREAAGEILHFPRRQLDLV